MQDCHTAGVDDVQDESLTWLKPKMHARRNASSSFRFGWALTLISSNSSTGSSVCLKLVGSAPSGCHSCKEQHGISNSAKRHRKKKNSLGSIIQTMPRLGWTTRHDAIHRETLAAARRSEGHSLQKRVLLKCCSYQCSTATPETKIPFHNAFLLVLLLA